MDGSDQAQRMPVTLNIALTPAEYTAVCETADLNNMGVTDWAKNRVISATMTNDDERLQIRKEIDAAAAQRTP